MHLPRLISSSLFILGAACAPIELDASASATGSTLSLLRRDPGKPECSVSNASLPQTGKGAELPAAASNLKLKFITLGIGTQNYTCADSTDSTKPALLGAVATIYDASCAVTKYSQMLDFISDAAVRLPTDMVNYLASRYLNLKVVGNHYFAGPVPMFDLRKDGHDEYVLVSVAAKVPAPSSENVDWLLLNRVDGVGLQSVYRVKTTSGKAPATCKNMPAQFQVKYIAQYWFYG
ncbi:hypothetical protein LOZ58_002313 [Ophidiomyces ophidiicola]|nr:hypothetical protein LOZ58_002313 [Ophidiomyces ophidiicola]